MTDDDAGTAISIIPTLGVPDLDEAVRYYRRVGFEERWRYPEGADATNVGLGCGQVTVMLALRPDGERVERQNFYVIMRDIASFHEAVRKELGDDVSPLVDADYGMRDFSLRDPWGHQLTFGEER